MNETFETVMGYFKSLPKFYQDILKNVSEWELVNDGAEEIGSSDLWHGVYNIFGRAWKMENGKGELDFDVIFDIQKTYEQNRK